MYYFKKIKTFLKLANFMRQFLSFWLKWQILVNFRRFYLANLPRFGEMKLANFKKFSILKRYKVKDLTYIRNLARK